MTVCTPEAPMPDTRETRPMEARLIVRIPDDLIHLVKATAARKSTTVSELTRSVLRQEAREELGIHHVEDDAA